MSLLIMVDISNILLSVETEKTILAFQQINKNLEHSAFYEKATSIIAQYERGALNTREFRAQIKKALSLPADLSDSEFDSAFCKMLESVSPKNVQYIASLKFSGYKVVAISNTNKIHWKYIQSALLRLGYRVSDIFDETSLSFITKKHKDSSEVFSDVLKKGIYEKAFLIDSSDSSLDYARKAGVYQIKYDIREGLSLKNLVNRRLIHQNSPVPKQEVIYIGIEVGASSINVLVNDKAGKTIGTFHMDKGATLSIMDAGDVWEKIITAIYGAFKNESLQNVSLEDKDFKFCACFGIPGAGIDEKREAFIKLGKSKYNYFDEGENLTVETDVAVTHLGIYQGEAGALIIVGTGMIALLLEKDNVGKKGGVSYPYLSGVNMIAGYGPMYSDGGSGAWTGHKVIRWLLDHSDEQNLDSSKALKAVYKHFFNEETAEFDAKAIPMLPPEEAYEVAKYFITYIKTDKKNYNSDQSDQDAFLYDTDLVDKILKKAAKKFEKSFNNLLKLARKKSINITSDKPVYYWGGFMKYILDFINPEIKILLRPLEKNTLAFQPVKGAILKAMIENDVPLQIAKQWLQQPVETAAVGIPVVPQGDKDDVAIPTAPPNFLSLWNIPKKNEEEVESSKKSFIPGQ